MNESDDFVEDDFQPDDFVEDEVERTPVEKGARIASQYGLGILEGTAPGMVYDIAVAPLSSKEAQTVGYREQLFQDINDLAEQKQTGVWSEQDQKLYDSLIDQVKNPEKMEEFVKTSPDLSIRGLASKVTGINLHPEDVYEKAASWAGFIRDPRKIKDLISTGITPKQLTKAILPYPHEVFRGIGAGTALQMAENGQFGPIGTLGAAILGDIAGHAPKGIGKIIANPKQAAAQTVNFLTMNNSRKLAATQLVQDFEKSNIKLDAGTLTDSPLIKMMQARLTQSGLTGTALDNFRKELSSQIVKEYENIIGDLGELTFENSYQASEAIKNALKVEEVSLNTQKGSLKKQMEEAPSLKGRVAVEERPDYQQTLLNKIAPEETRNNYQGGENLKIAAEDIRQPMKEEFNRRWEQFNASIENLEREPQVQLMQQIDEFLDEHRGSLLLGESAPEARVFTAAQRLRDVLRNEEVSLMELIRTKRTLADVANWEMANSDFTSSYKRLVGELNSAIDRSLAKYPEIRSDFLNLNADYEAFKNAFENKNLEKLFNPSNHNYNTIYNDFVNNPDKLRSLEDVFYVTPRGEQLINQIKRDYAQKILEKPDLTARDIRSLQNVLGEEFDPAILEFMTSRQQALEHPLPRISQQESLGIKAQIPKTKSSLNLKNKKVSETGTESAKTGLRKKMSESLIGKDSTQIMHQMDTIEGIRKLRRALETTPEGKELFKELSRFKLAELIDKKMKDSVTAQIKLGTFSNLLSTRKTRDIVKELLSPKAFEELELLQKNSGLLAKSAGKFFNASQSGTTVTDVGLIGAAFSGMFLGIPSMAVPAMLKVGGSYVLANLLADPVFLKELEKAITTSNPKKFTEILIRMRPAITKAMKEAEKLNNEEKP